MTNMHPHRPFQLGSLTPVLDPILDDYEEDSNDSPQLRPQQMLKEPFAMLSLEEDEEEDEETLPENDNMLPGNPQLQMPQPRPFTLRHTAPNAMLNANRPITPPRHNGTAQLLPQQQITSNTSPRWNQSTTNPFLQAPPMVRAH